MKYDEPKDNDLVLPLKYYEGRDVYHVPAFVEPGRFVWYKTHSDCDYYIRQIDVGVYQIGSFGDKKAPNAKKMSVVCPDEDIVILQPVNNRILFCGSCAPHKFVKGGEIYKRNVSFEAENGRMNYQEV